MKTLTPLLFTTVLLLAGISGCSDENEDPELLTEVINGVEITRTTPSAKFAPRRAHTGLSFNNKMWVIGGYNLNEEYSDVWSSTDGTTWNLVTGDAAFGTRLYHASVVFDNKMWVVGGVASDNKESNDVWFSEDGKAWTLATGAAAFPKRMLHKMVVFNNKMWILGGSDDKAEILKDAWYSDDGVTWTKATDDIGDLYVGFTAVVYEDELFLIGNMEDGGVWSSQNGVTWNAEIEEDDDEHHSDETGPVYSYGHIAGVIDNDIWTTSGISKANYNNAIWSSNDGVDWDEEVDTTPYAERAEAASMVFAEKLWLIGGYDPANDKNMNDVWSIQRIAK